MLAPSPRRLSDEWNESNIGRALELGKLTEDEFRVGSLWFELYRDYLRSIGAPGYENDEPLSDARCEEVKERIYSAIDEIKKNVGRQAFHAMNALIVYGEPEELMDYEWTVAAAKKGLAHLVKVGL